MKQHNSGKQKFGHQLRNIQQTCENCGFESTILGGDWDVRAGVTSWSHHLVYHLTCPRCRTETEIESNIGIL